MSRPILPKEVVSKKSQLLPSVVFDVFNELITENWDGKESRFTISDVYACFEKYKVESIKPTWLDVEPTYREAGWVVAFDKPGYNESYSGTYMFRKRNF